MLQAESLQPICRLALDDDAAVAVDMDVKSLTLSQPQGNQRHAAGRRSAG